MLLELMTIAMLNPDTDLLAQNIQEQPKTQTEQQVKSKNYSVKILMPEKNKTRYKTFAQFYYDNAEIAKKTVEEFASRYERDGQFLKWVELPEKQLELKRGKSNVDKIYEQAYLLSARKTTVNRPLVVLGIGGSKHTAEFLLNMTGFDRKRPVYFYSDIDPVSYKNFLEETGLELQNLNFLVVSKSGTTFETADGFKRFENDLIKYYKETGLDDEKALKKAQMHFAICTDANPTEKNLRGKIGSKNGTDNSYIKELYIHNDVGGRYSMFDDAGIFVLAYAGVKPEITKRILQGAINANTQNLNVKNPSGSLAVQGALFNLMARQYKYSIIQQQYFGKLFEGAGENWAKQLYLESLKDFDYVVGKAPDSMHYATEGHFSPQNRTKYNTVMTIMNPSISDNYNKYTSAIAATYAETTPVKIEILEVENNAIKPETIGEYIQTKHFETVFMGIMRRLATEKENYKNLLILPEILQPSVETYKNKFKPGSPYELTPGK
ncbi:MAG: hypothetical protein K6C94_08800 [Candidatus Gastranaerophilales bacterium]|nr:hypothetical protein [Candidatus Gastranaerophilales bacterium]